MLRIISNGPQPGKHMYRDRVALRLLLEWAIRKGALQAIQYKHFDRPLYSEDGTLRRPGHLVIFTKGEKVFDKTIPDEDFWRDLDLAQMALGAEPEHFLMGSRQTFNRFAGYDPVTGEKKVQRIEMDRPEKALGGTAMHRWWYGCLERAGIAQPGQTSGQKMHKARHSSGQALLEEFHDIKLVQKHLGHASPTTTLETYVDYDDFALSEHMAVLLERRRDRSE
jgi:integrase